MINTISRRRCQRLVLPLVLLLMLAASPGWMYQHPVLAAPAPQQGGITPIRDPQACTPENKGGVFITFEDLPTATHVAEQYAPLGVHFVDNRVTTPLIYSNISERDTSSKPNSLTNDADAPNTSASVPLTITFDAPQSVVGFYLGNGPADGQTGALRAYDGAGSLLGSVPLPTISNDVTLFYGVSDSLARIQRIELDYGNTARSEEIDDLCFSRAQTEPQIRTFKGRVLQSGRLERPTPLPGVQVALYGSNNAAILGTLLSSATSALETGAYELPTNQSYLYYTLVEGPAPQGYCRLRAVAGPGGAALDAERIQYASPAPGTYGGNDFYNATGALCEPPPPIASDLAALPFLRPIERIPEIRLPQIDLQGTRIEVNQAIQTDGNTVSQVLGKWTVVRVYVKSGSVLTINNVLVRLHIFLNGSEAAVVDARTRAVPSPQRTNKDDSANFYLAAFSGSNATLGFYAEIDPNNEVIETNETNNRFPGVGTQNHTFFVRQGITISYAPVSYTFSGWSGPGTPTSRIHTAVDWLRSIYPVPNTSTRSAVYYPYPGFSFNENVNTNDYKLISRLNTRWFLSHWGLGALGWLLGIDVGPSANQLYGWLPEGAYSSNGLSDPTWAGGSSHVSFGNDTPDKYRRTLAHEIGHNLGLCHNNRFIDTVGFDVLLSQTVRDTSYRDFMWPARREDEAWIDTTNYTRLFNWLAPGATVPAGGSSCLTVLSTQQHGASVQQLNEGAHEFVFLTGAVSKDGTQGVLDPLHRDVRAAGDFPPSIGSQFCLAQLNAGGEVLAQHCFTPDFEDPGDGEVDRAFVTFAVPMLWNPATRRVELRNYANSTPTLAARDVSANAPAVSVTSPNGGETFAAGADIPITWTASDADGDALTYSVFYSPDGGASWVPVADGLTATSYTLSAAAVAGSENARVKVIASDGANSGQDQSDAAFSVARKPPQVFISAPANGSTVAPNAAVVLEGVAIDLEDGNLDGASLQWASSKDGSLGSGPALVVPPLSPGLHTITLKGTDSDNNSVEASVQIFVGGRVFLPIVQR